MNERSGHMFNMFIMRYDYFTDYCSWLFDILFNLDKNINYNSRIFGFIGERILDVFLLKNKITYKELSIQYIEKQKIIQKSIKFIIRKFE